MTATAPRQATRPFTVDYLLARMFEHLGKYEAAKAEVDRAEDEALARARRDRQGRPVSSRGGGLPDGYFVAKDLEKDFTYQVASAKQKSNERHAMLYAAVVIAARLGRAS